MSKYTPDYQIRRADSASINTTIAVLSPIMDRIKKHEPKSEVLALRYGPMMLGALAVLPGFGIVTAIRNAHKMQKIQAGTKPPKMLAAGLSSMMAMALQTYQVKFDLLLGKTQCDVCLQSRALCIQAVCGIGMPYLISAVGTYHSIVGLGFQHKKDGVNPTAMAKYLGRMLSKCRTTLATQFVIQSIATSVIVWRMQMEWIDMSAKIDAENQKRQFIL